MGPIVTIGVPTFNRPELLSRALVSVARQDYPNIEVLVADNATPGDLVGRVVEASREAIPGLRYTRHEQNIGALRNFLFLLSAAKGRYFMWLADDDEISANYVGSLVDLLESDPGAACATGHHVLMENERDSRLMPTSSYRQTLPFVRALRFIWRTDDAFFYALHRTDVLREASFRGYWWPNRGVLRNWAYVYLLDVVLRGRVLLASDTSVQYINHDYIPKTQPVLSRSIAGIAARAIRRFNVHVLFWEKCARQLNPLFIPLVVATSVCSLIRDGAAKGLHMVQVARNRAA